MNQEKQIEVEDNKVVQEAKTLDPISSLYDLRQQLYALTPQLEQTIKTQSILASKIEESFPGGEYKQFTEEIRDRNKKYEEEILRVKLRINSLESIIYLYETKDPKDEHLRSEISKSVEHIIRCLFEAIGIK